MPISLYDILYLAAVLAIGGYITYRTLRYLGRTEELEIAVLKRRRRFESIETDTPLKDPKKVSLERGIESIESQFTVMKRSLIPIIIGVTVVLAAVPFVSDTSASIVAAVIAVLAGLAMRPLLENAIAGIVLSSSKLVRIGDTVRINDLYGTVEDITATHTALKVWDWRRYLVPNSLMLQSNFFNYSLYDTFQWAYVDFWVSPEANIDEVREIAIHAPKTSSHCYNGEEPTFWVVQMDKDAISCGVAAWAATPADAWGLTSDIRAEILREFQKRNIRLSLQRHHWRPEPPPNDSTSPSGQAD